MDRQSKQATLDGVFVPPLPKVRSTEGHIFEWDRAKIVAQIENETRLVEHFYGYAPATKEQAEEIARVVEERIRNLGLQFLSGALIREIVNMVFLEKGMVEYRNVCTRVGTPVYDAHLIDVGRGFEAHDNANLQENAETSHKKKADKISKEQYLLQLPPDLADRHLAGDLHVHDLEYFGTRPFCLDGSTVVPFRAAGRHYTLRLDEVPFDGDEYLPDDLAVLTPQGYQGVQKVTRRQVEEGELLQISTASGKSLLATREHRVPVQADGSMQITRAGAIREGDLLYGLGTTPALRGTPVDTIDLVKELFLSVPLAYLENVVVRGARPIFERLSAIEGSFTAVSRALGIEHHKEWFTRGTMPLVVFSALCEYYEITDYGDLRIGVAGSERNLPAVLPVTPSLCRLLGTFVPNGTYEVVPGSSYSLVVTGTGRSDAVLADVRGALSDERADLAGHTEAMRVRFGGKLEWLLFRYVFAVPEESEKKHLPWLVWHLDDAHLREFLSALFTAGGTVSDGAVTYTTPSPTTRQDLSLLLSALGMHPQVVGTSSPFSLRLDEAGDLRTFAAWAGFLDEKQEQFEAGGAAVHEAGAFSREEVVSSTAAVPSGEYVYDLFLEGDGSEESHTFYASDGLLIHNCQDWDLRYFFYYGLMPDGNGTKASVAGPARRAEVAVLHAVKALGSAQTNFAGGQGYYNFLTFLSPYFEGMEYGEMKQLMQMFVYEMTQMMVARGGQLVFSSVQLSPGVPTLWRDKPCVYKGKVWDGRQAPLRTYGEFEREVRLLFKAMMEVMLEGDYWGKPFSFPKPEISIEPDFMTEDEEFNRTHPDLPSYQDLYLLTFELASKFGTPYYDNQLPPYRGAGKGISCYQCCAYQFSSTFEKDDHFEEKLYFKDGSHFSMGSWEVVSVNCPRAAYKAEGDDERLFAELRALMDVAVEVFKVKRRWMETIRTNGRMPFAMQRPKDPQTGERGAVAVDLESLVYTIGVVGVNEMVQYHTGHQLHESKDAFKMAVRAMTEMELYAKTLSEKNGMTIALARTPAETTGQRFAVSDMLDDKFREAALGVMQGDPEAAVADCGTTRDLPVYYTNGTHVSPGADVPLTKRMEVEHVFFPIVDGGNIFHIWLGEARPDPRGLYDMAMNLCKKTQIGYFAFTRDLTVSLKRFKEYRGEPKVRGKLEA
ncbi:MAG: anaerobic ribonucleoside-triphosphate reductase [Methanofollis sp.]|nr:anaerobic ribonucleoside-triphosphate reductase [Methanofollis sp.]